MRTCILSDMCSFVSLTKFILGWPNTLGSNLYGELTSHDEDLPWHVPFKICNSPLQCQTTSVVPRTFNRNGSGTTRTGECNWFVGDVLPRALQKAHCAMGITYWWVRIAKEHILWIATTTQEDGVGSESGQIANIWLLSWKLFSVTHLCVRPPKTSGESDKSSFKVSLQTPDPSSCHKPVLRPRHFVIWLSVNIKGSKEDPGDCCLFNQSIWRAGSPTVLLRKLRGAWADVLCQQGQHPDPDTDESVKRRFHTLYSLVLS